MSRKAVVNIKEFISRYKNGERLDNLAKEYKACAKRLRVILREHNIPVPYTKYLNYTYEDLEDHCVLYLKDKFDIIYEVFIDNEDLSKILSSNLGWFVIEQKAGKNRVVSYRRSVLTYLHRMIINAGCNDIVDHINCNPLDNRKNNLRITDATGNSHNLTVVPKSNTSGIVGVSWDKEKKKWAAYIGVNGKHVFLGRYNDKELAATAYKQAKIKYHPTSQEAMEASIV